VTPENVQIYKQHLPLLEDTVQWMNRRLARLVPLDDLRSLAHHGLVEAVHSYDPSRSSATTYIGRKMRWAILDAVRHERRMQRLCARTAAILASERLAQHDEDVPDEPGSTEEEHVAALDAKLDKHAAGLAIGLISSLSRGGELEDTPEEHTAWAQEYRALREVIRGLPERERQLIERHYFEGEDFDTIAKELGISKSWASRLHAQAIELVSRGFRERLNADS
jgi:RNA polymerase sigma factor for flagellar operon FliA